MMINKQNETRENLIFLLRYLSIILNTGHCPSYREWDIFTESRSEDFMVIVCLCRTFFLHNHCLLLKLYVSDLVT